MRNRGRQGFTLVEILVVVVILGILSTIVVVKVSKHGENTRITTTRAIIGTIMTAISTYELQIGEYPPNLQDLVKEGDDKWPGPFIDAEQVPKDAWGNDFQYELRGKRVRVTSPGRDGQFGTKDDLWNS